MVPEARDGGWRRRCSKTVAGALRSRLRIQRLSLARARNDLRAVAEEAQRLLASTEATEFGLGEEVRTSVLTDLGIAETWAGRLDDAARHLEQGLEEARRIARPMLELQALANWALLSSFRSLATAEQRATQTIELARKHGWEETAPAAATAYVVLGRATVWRGRLREAEPWLDLAERVLERDTQPNPALMLYATRALLECARGRHAEAAAAYRDAERMERLLVMPHMFTTRVQALKLQMLVGVGETEQVERALAEMDEEVRETSQMRVVLAALRLARDDPEAAVDALAPLPDDSTPVMASMWEIEALLLEAIARDALRDPAAASRALERALDVAEPDGLLLPFLLYPTAELLERQARLRTTHASLIAEILNLLSGHDSGGAAQGRRAAPGTPLRERAARAALPADQPPGAGNRGRAVRVAEHDQDPLAQRVRQARRAQPRRRGEASARARPALALLAQALTRVAVSRTSRGAQTLDPAPSPAAIARAR